MKRISILTFIALLVACNASPSRTNLTEITASAPGSYLPPSLCELTRMADTVGNYTVSSMYSQVEAVDGADNAFTYIELKSLDTWVGTDTESLVVRTIGGPLPYKRNGKWEEGTVGWRVSLTVGEEIVLFSAPEPHNDGFTDIALTSLFRKDAAGLYTSPYLFERNPVEVDEFRRLVQQIASAPTDAACPVDEFPEGYVAPSDTPPEPNEP